MKIGIIMHPYNEKKPAGLARFILELTKEMLANDIENEYIIFAKNASQTPEFIRKHPKAIFIHYNFKFLWLDRTLLRGPRADVYLFNTPVIPLFFQPKNILIVVLDFAYRYFPGETLKEKISKKCIGIYHKYSLYRANKIIAISEATKRDVELFAGIKPENIHVTLLGHKNIKVYDSYPKPLPTNYFLFVGVIKERKNVARVFEAYLELQKKYSNYSLIIVGKGHGQYFDDIVSSVRQGGMKDKVIFLNHIPDYDLGFLYSHATALVFPSLIEGFGFPILEAMQCGTPVITSNVSSLPEVAGDAALLVNPYSIEEITDAMEKIITDVPFRQKCIELGRKRAALFTWKKTAIEFLRIIKTCTIK